MSESVAENAGKIFGKLRARRSETQPAAPAPKAPAAPMNVDRINPKAKYGDKPGEQRIDVSDMTKPLTSQAIPSYKHGTGYVPKTGPAILHEGEKVTPARDNVMDKITGGVPAKVVSHMVHRKHAADHHSVENHHTRPEHHGQETHHFHGKNAMDQVHGHMEDQMGTPNPGEADADAGQSGIPPAPGAGGAPAGGAPMPSYEDGVDSVPKTGPAVLHKGEKVTPAAGDAQPSPAAPAAAPAAPAKNNVMDKITGGAKSPDAAKPADLAAAQATPGTSTSTGGATATRNTGAATGGAVTITISGSSSTGTSTETSTETHTSTATTTGAGAGKGAKDGKDQGKDQGKAAPAAAGKAPSKNGLDVDTGDKRPHIYNITVNSTGKSGEAIDGGASKGSE